MSTPAPSSFFHRRIVGRASSPPTWACYEQIIDSFDDDEEFSDSASDAGDSCSEDGEDYHRSGTAGTGAGEMHSDSEESDHEKHDDDHTGDMDIDQDADAGNGTNEKDAISEANKKDVKGKQRAVEPEPESPRSRKSRRHRRSHVETLRPILTIHRSQGFVWNQDLFVPPYIKDRYIASTSPPNSKGLLSGAVGSNNSALPDYEVEVVEILVRDGELNDIIP